MSNEILSFGETTSIHKSGDDVNVENNEEMPHFYSLSSSASSAMPMHNTKSLSVSRRQTQSFESSVISSDASFAEQSFDTDGGDFMTYSDCTNQLSEYAILFTDFFDVAKKPPKSSRRKKNIRQPNKTKQESREVDEGEKDTRINKQSRDEVDQSEGNCKFSSNSPKGEITSIRQFSSNRPHNEMTLKTGSTKKAMKMTSIKSLKSSKSLQFSRCHNKNLM